MHEFHSDLYEQLRTKRNELAREKRVRPYFILANRSLEEMATDLPQTQEEFANIWGIGPITIQYAGVFLPIIRQYCKEHALRADAPIEFQYALFELLRLRRIEVARRDNTNDLQVFRDRTLEDLATHLPKTREEFRQIWGVDEGRTARYADDFLPIIRQYCGETNEPPLQQVAESSVAFDQNPTAIISVEEEQYADPNEYAPRLYELLRDERDRIPERVNAFQDRTLKQMAAYLPQTESEFLNIDRIGSLLTERYADRFLPIIRDFCRENGISYDRIEPRQRELLDWLRR